MHTQKLWPTDSGRDGKSVFPALGIWNKSFLCRILETQNRSSLSYGGPSEKVNQLERTFFLGIVKYVSARLYPSFVFFLKISIFEYTFLKSCYHHL